MFSATGNLLSGSPLRPDILTVIEVQNSNFVSDKKSSTYMFSYTFSPFDKLGCIPLVSTVSGLGRVLLGVVHAITHLACAIFDKINREYHFNEVRFGLKNVSQGLVEMFPIVGNVISMKRYAEKEKHFEKIARQNIHSPANDNLATVFINGKEITKKPIGAYLVCKKAILRGKAHPSAQDIEKVLSVL